MNEMTTPIAFQSSKINELEREKKKVAQNKHLAKIKKDYDRKQKEEEDRKKRGEDKWMLPSVSERIDEESKKHKKKHKKEKKHKKKKKKKQHSDGSSSDEAEPIWIEKSTESEQEKPKNIVIKGPHAPQREDWMSLPTDLIPTVTRDQLREKIRKDKEEKEGKPPDLDQLGQHERELNPYWKDGGTGLPEQKLAKSTSPKPSAAGDGGLGWLKKSYQRCVQQAEDEGRKLEDVASERWGSLKDLEEKIAKAEQALKKDRSTDRGGRGAYRDRQKRNFKRPSSRSPSSSFKRYRSRSRSRERHRSRSKSSDQQRSRSREYRRSRSRSRDRRRSRSRSRDRQRSRSRSRDRRRSRSRDHRRSRSRSRDRKRSRSRSRDRQRSRSRERHSQKSDRKVSRFMRPGDLDDDKRSGGSRSKSSNVPGWKKAGFVKPGNDDDDDEIMAKRFVKPRDSPKQPSTESNSEDSSSDSSESEEEPPEPEVIPLTEDEMNKLGAKILKAELMGNQALADKLKAQIEAARNIKPRVAKPSSSKTKSNQDDLDDESIVVLTRTDRMGNVRPLPAQEEQPAGGRRRKKKVITHNEDGKRDRYFADDDKFDLKTLVEREKLGSAEDQDQMFSRLAGRALEKTDDDFQLDDIFIERGAKKETDARTQEKERAMAIGEHRRMQQSLDKCLLCLEKCPKHLIIAIGVKTYLCLPNSKSLTEGHCLIIPIHHCPASTAIDEDVWHEIQVFRKGLTKMFEERGEDVVFMETSLGLRHSPHMIIECIPMEKEVGDMAPIYFKKAIMESETEWAQNKKLVDLSKKDIRHSVPKGFPYFSVDFGLQGGYAHVVENEQDFPVYFGREIVGGMLDLEPRMWRKPQKETFDDQRKKVLNFAEIWKPYDWTRHLQNND